VPCGFAHVGDVLFNGSVGRSDIPGGDHATLIKSITDKLLPLGDDVSFICGHGPGSSIGQERRTNRFSPAGCSGAPASPRHGGAYSARRRISRRSRLGEIACPGADFIR